MSSVTDGPSAQWKTQIQALVSQMSSESGKTVPIETQVGLLTDTKASGFRIAGELETAEQALAASCAKGVAHTDSKDRASRIDLAQLLEPDAASRVILDDLGVTGDESELDLSE